VGIIEAGFPPSSPKDFDAVQTITEEIKGLTICALSRPVVTDIESCGKALAKHRIHTGIRVSDIHLTGKLRDERYPKSHHLDIEFHTEKLVA
jgi:2-isopropylmalate synthase